jgi:hypothetical protein
MQRPTPDPIPPDPLDDLGAPALGARLDRVVEERLWAAAAETDGADELPIGHFRAIADLGLYGMVIPAADGGLGLSPPQVRAVLRRLGSGCAATGFAFAQHHGTAAAVAASPNRELRDRWLGRLAADALAGIAYAHVRRPGPPVLRAQPAGDGSGAWVLDGRAPWVTSWGLAEVLGVAAVGEGDRMVWALVPAREGPSLRMAKRFDLAVMGATATVALDFERYRVEPDHLIDVLDFSTWSARDRHLAARPNPLCLGVGDRALRLLSEADPMIGRELAPVWSDVVERSEAQAVAVDQHRADLATVARMRAESVLTALHLTTALLAATGGRAVERSHPAQRLGREAGFFVVQAQNEDGRRATLEAVRRSVGRRGGTGDFA